MGLVTGADAEAAAREAAMSASLAACAAGTSGTGLAALWLLADSVLCSDSVEAAVDNAGFVEEVSSASRALSSLLTFVTGSLPICNKHDTINTALPHNARH